MWRYVHICVSFVSYTAYSRPHPFLISVWSIAGCCDAVRGELCQSRGTVTFQWTGITLLTLLLWLEFSLSSLRDDLTLFTLRRDAGGCSKLVPLLHPTLCLFFTSAVRFCWLICFQIFFFLNFLSLFLFSSNIAVLLNYCYIDFYMLNLQYIPHSCSQCHLKITYHKICNFCYGLLLLLYKVTKY